MPRFIFWRNPKNVRALALFPVSPPPCIVLSRTELGTFPSPPAPTFLFSPIQILCTICHVGETTETGIPTPIRHLIPLRPASAPRWIRGGTFLLSFAARRLEADATHIHTPTDFPSKSGGGVIPSINQLRFLGDDRYSGPAPATISTSIAPFLFTSRHIQSAQSPSRLGTTHGSLLAVRGAAGAPIKTLPDFSAHLPNCAGFIKQPVSPPRRTDPARAIWARPLADPRARDKRRGETPSSPGRKGEGDPGVGEVEIRFEVSPGAILARQWVGGERLHYTRAPRLSTRRL